MKEIIKKYRKNLTIIGFLIIVCNLLHSIHPFIVKKTLDIDFNLDNIDKIIFGLITTYITIHIVFALFKNIRNIIVNKTMAAILKSIREELFNKVLNMKMINFNKYSSSELYTRLTSDVENLFNLFSGLLNIVINNVIYIAFMVILMFFADVKLALIGTATIILITIIVCMFTRILGKLDNKILKKRDKENKMFSELYNKNKITQLFRLQEKI